MHTWHHDKKDTTVFGENKQIQRFKHKHDKKDKHKQRTTVFGEKDMIKKTNTNKFKNKKRQRNTKN